MSTVESVLRRVLSSDVRVSSSLASRVPVSSSLGASRASKKRVSRVSKASQPAVRLFFSDRTGPVFAVLLPRAMCLLLLLIVASLATVDLVMVGFLLEATGAVRLVITGFRVFFRPVETLTLLCALARLWYRFILPAGFVVYHSRPARSVGIGFLLGIDDSVVLGIHDECLCSGVSGYFGPALSTVKFDGTLIEGG